MKFWRSLLVTFSFVIFGFGASVLNFLILPVAKIFKKKEEFRIFVSKAINISWGWFIGLLELIGLIKLQLKNREELKKIEGKVIAASHPSFIDIVILMSLIPKSVCFVKSALAKNPIFKNILSAIFITNDTELDGIKEETKEFLKAGFNIIIFPTGSRHRQDEHLKIKKGASLIALNAGVNIVPVQIKTSEDFLFINQPFYEGGKKTVIFEVEVHPEIEINLFKDKDDIAAKKEVTKEIERAIYKNS